MDAKRLDTVNKLLAKAERAGTPEEADTFYAKAQELMTKWSIDDAMLRSAKPMTEQKKPSYKTMILSKSGIWKQYLTLISCLARPNDVEILISMPRGAGSKPVVHMIGFEEDIANLEMLYTSMLIQNSRLRRQMLPEYLKSKENEKAKWNWIKSFMESFAYRIEARLAEMKVSATQAAEAEYGSNLLPVLASKKDIVKDELKRRFPATKATRASRSNHWSSEGHRAGQEAGDRTDIGQKRVSGRKELL